MTNFDSHLYAQQAMKAESIRQNLYASTMALSSTQRKVGGQENTDAINTTGNSGITEKVDTTTHLAGVIVSDWTHALNDINRAYGGTTVSGASQLNVASVPRTQPALEVSLAYMRRYR